MKESKAYFYIGTLRIPMSLSQGVPVLAQYMQAVECMGILRPGTLNIEGNLEPGGIRYKPC